MNTSQYGCFVMGRLYTRDFFARFSILNKISGDMHTTTDPFTVIEFLTTALQQDEKWLSIIIAHLEEPTCSIHTKNHRYREFCLQLGCTSDNASSFTTKPFPFVLNLAIIALDSKSAES
jgi:hypothetical protein